MAVLLSLGFAWIPIVMLLFCCDGVPCIIIAGVLCFEPY